MGVRAYYRRFRRLRRAVRRGKNAGLSSLVKSALYLVRKMSLEKALRRADRLGDIAYFVASGTRRLALEHVRSALGEELSATAYERVIRASFRNVARCFVEVAKFDEIRPRLDDYVQIEGWEHVETVLAEGRGAIAITGHIGNWELLAAFFGLRGVPVAAVARRIDPPGLNSAIVDFRRSNGVQTILRESPRASREILGILRANGILAMLIDQDTRAPSVSVPFFGRMARTPAAAASLAIRRQLPVLAVFAQRRGTDGHRLTVLPPIRLESTGDRRQDIAALTRRFNQILEDRIRRNPAEWVWWHRRWRHGPIARLDLDSEPRSANTIGRDRG